jgi:hypothetical protein
MLLGTSLMNTAKEGGPLPTKMADVVKDALDDDTHRFLSVLSQAL